MIYITHILHAQIRYIMHRIVQADLHRYLAKAAMPIGQHKQMQDIQ